VARAVADWVAEEMVAEEMVAEEMVCRFGLLLTAGK